MLSRAATSQERVASEVLPLLGALQEKAARRLAELQEGRDRGLGVIEERVGDGDHVEAFAESTRLLQGGRESETGVVHDYPFRRSSSASTSASSMSACARRTRRW